MSLSQLLIEFGTFLTTFNDQQTLKIHKYISLLSKNHQKHTKMVFVHASTIHFPSRQNLFLCCHRKKLRRKIMLDTQKLVTSTSSQVLFGVFGYKSCCCCVLNELFRLIFQHSQESSSICVLGSMRKSHSFVALLILIAKFSIEWKWINSRNCMQTRHKKRWKAANVSKGKVIYFSPFLSSFIQRLG